MLLPKGLTTARAALQVCVVGDGMFFWGFVGGGGGGVLRQGLLHTQVTFDARMHIASSSLTACKIYPYLLPQHRIPQALLEAFDASNVSSGMLWSLIQGWCGDVAAALAAHATDVEPSVQLAANAAAGRWSAVVSGRWVWLFSLLY